MWGLVPILCLFVGAGDHFFRPYELKHVFKLMSKPAESSIKPRYLKISVVFIYLFFCLSASGIGVAEGSFVVKGKIASTQYDEHGNLVEEELVPGVVTPMYCDFVWYRDGEKWRLDLREINPKFSEGVWRTILPLSTNELISIHSYPPRPGVSDAKGNAFVKVMTNFFLPAQHSYGAHAVWLAFNLEQVLNRVGPEGVCPPFFLYDPRIHNLQFPSHRIIITNNAVVFWNPGKYFDSLVLENGSPVLRLHNPPIDKGFKEVELKFSSEKMDFGVPKLAELIYWIPYKDDSNETGYRLVMLSKLSVIPEVVEAVKVPASTFTANWTNAHAVVVDTRASISSNSPLSYVTKKKMLDGSEKELKKTIAAQRRFQALADKRPSSKGAMLLGGFVIVGTILPLVGWFFWKRRYRG